MQCFNYDIKYQDNFQPYQNSIHFENIKRHFILANIYKVAIGNLQQYGTLVCGYVYWNRQKSLKLEAQMCCVIYLMVLQTNYQAVFNYGSSWPEQSIQSHTSFADICQISNKTRFRCIQYKHCAFLVSICLCVCLISIYIRVG